MGVGVQILCGNERIGILDDKAALLKMTSFYNICGVCSIIKSFKSYRYAKQSF